MLSFSKLVVIRSQLHNVVGSRLLAIPGPLQTPVATLKTVEERIGVPIRPKRPLVPFMRFYKDIRPDLVQANPAKPMGVLAQLAADKWKQTDQTTRERYYEDFRKDQEVFLKEIARYQNVLTDEQREKVKQMKLLISEKRKSREKRQKARELGKPKHPVPAFTQFLTELTLKIDKSKMVCKEFAITAGEKWRALSDAEKAPYLEKYKKDMDSYRKEIQKWEEKMIKAGNQELVRRKVLMETDSNVAAVKKATKTPKAATKSPRDTGAGSSVRTKRSVATAGSVETREQSPEEPSIQVGSVSGDKKQSEQAETKRRGVGRFLKFF